MARRRSSAYAVLGLLGIRSWSPYELVSHMRRSTISFIWPRAASKLYEEPKRLVQRGWASAADGGDGRTTYAITPTGSQALRDWLREPGGGVTLESEGLLKVLFADSGSKDDLLATIRSVRDEMQASQEAVLRANAEEFVRSGPTFPERAHLSALVAELIAGVHDAVLEWADWAEERVASWSDVTGSPGRAEQAVTTAQQWLDAHPRRPDDLTAG